MPEGCDGRVLPYWRDRIVPQLRQGLTPLVVCHGNSIRALLKHLENISDEEISSLNIPTGIPLLYELDANLEPAGSRYLGDPRLPRLPPLGWPRRPL